MAAYEVLLLNTAVPQIQAAQSGDTYVVPRDIAFSAALTLSAGTANGVPYLNASKVLTTGSALTFDGTNFATTGAVNLSTLSLKNNAPFYTGANIDAGANALGIGGGLIGFFTGGSEQMRLTSTGLGIGTSLPGAKLDVNGGTNSEMRVTTSGSGYLQVGQFTNGAFIGTSSSDATAGILRLGTGGSTVATLDTSGNLGLGVVPSAWSGYHAIQMGAYANFYNTNAGQTGLATSTYNNGTNWIYNSNNPAFRYEQDLASQSHRWFIAPTGTAGNAITFTQAMTLDASGNLGIGTTSPSDKLTVAAGRIRLDQDFQIVWQNAGTNRARILGDASSNIIFETGSSNTERARITSVGNFKIGGTADRATTEGTNQLVLFNGTAPVGTLTNGVSFYSASGEARVMDAAGNSTLLSPHDQTTNEWIFHSKHTPTGKVLRIDVERLLKFVNDHFGLDAVHEFIEE